jgi:hypothetical protein
MQLCFVSVHGPRESYFVDEPRTIYIQGLFRSRIGTITSGLLYYDSLDIHMTAAKFKPLIFSLPGFALSNVGNNFIFMILDEFCLLLP